MSNKQEITPVGDIEPGSQDINIKVKIIQLQTNKIQIHNNQHFQATGQMADQNSVIDFSLLDENARKIQLNHVYLIKHIDCPVKKSHMILQSNQDTEIIQQNDEIQVPQKPKNISQDEYELKNQDQSSSTQMKDNHHSNNDSHRQNSSRDNHHSNNDSHRQNSSRDNHHSNNDSHRQNNKYSDSNVVYLRQKNIEVTKSATKFLKTLNNENDKYEQAKIEFKGLDTNKKSQQGLFLLLTITDVQEQQQERGEKHVPYQQITMEDTTTKQQVRYNHYLDDKKYNVSMFQVGKTLQLLNVTLHYNKKFESSYLKIDQFGQIKPYDTSKAQ